MKQIITNSLKQSPQKLISFCLIILFCLSGCSNEVLKETVNDEILTNKLPIIEPANVNQLRGEILLWHSLGRKNKYILDKTIRTYQQIQPNVKIIFEDINEDEFVSRFLRDFQRGLGPNVILVDYFWTLDLIRANALLPLELKQLNSDNLLPAALTQVTYKNKVYALPLALLTQVLCYNKNKVDVNNLPETLDDLITQAILGHSVGLPSSFVGTFWGIKIFGGNIFDSVGRISFKPGSWAAWLTWLQQAKTEPNIILNPNSDALEKAFKDNRLAYLVCDSTIIPRLRRSLGADNFGITLLPHGEKGEAGPLLYARVLAIVQGGSTMQTQIALDFSRFMTNSQQSKRRLTEIGSIILPDQNIKLDQRLFPIAGVLMQQSKTGVAIPLDYIDKTYTIFTTAEALYQQVIEGAIAPEEAGVKLLKLVEQKLSQNS